MMPIQSPNSKEIIKLLSKLKAETLEYPADMLMSRKAAFLKQAVTLKIQGKGQGGEGGQQGGSGGSGSALGGSTAAPSIALQALIGFGLVALMLLGAYLFREQDPGLLDENVVAVSESTEPTSLPGPNSITTSIIKTRPTKTTPTVETPEITTTVIESTPTAEELINGITVGDGAPGGPTANPGLHLGETPETPAAPGQGNPGNVNQPDKPDKPDKPNKPDKPGR